MRVSSFKDRAHSHSCTCRQACLCTHEQAYTHTSTLIISPVIWVKGPHSLWSQNPGQQRWTQQVFDWASCSHLPTDLRPVWAQEKGYRLSSRTRPRCLHEISRQPPATHFAQMTFAAWTSGPSSWLMPEYPIQCKVYTMS